MCARIKLRRNAGGFFLSPQTMTMSRTFIAKRVLTGVLWDKAVRWDARGFLYKFRTREEITL